MSDTYKMAKHLCIYGTKRTCVICEALADERARIEAEIKDLYDGSYGMHDLAETLNIVRGDDE